MTSAQLDPLVDGDATIRMLAETDLALTLAWRNHADSRRWFNSSDLIASEQHEQWFTRYLASDDDYVFIVEIAGEPVAQVSLYRVVDEEAEFGRLLVDPEQRGRGHSHAAIALCVRVAGESLGLSRLHLEVKPDNVSAIRAYEAAGFQRVESRRGLGGALEMSLSLR